MSWRSLLFVPGHRIELLAKVPRCQPDAVIVDLEDAVAEPDKETAREALAKADLAVAGSPVIVRVNAPGTPWHDDDVAACIARSGVASVLVPKAEDPAVVAGLSRRLEASGSDIGLLLGIESALGIARARELLATPGVDGAYFGSEDFLVDMGGRRTASGLELLYARSEVVLAGRLAGVPVIDQAVMAVDDDDAFGADAAAGRALGYAGKLCVHPRQVPLANAAFSPTDTEVAAARRVLEATAEGVAVLDGQMVDAVHIRMSRQVIERAEVR
jgi:citrate lyase subunit beta / citryl-CoA lyase